MEFPRWVDPFFDDDRLLTGEERIATPAVNVAEDTAGYTLEIAAPGMDKKDIRVTIDKGALLIEAESRKSAETQEDNYTRQEFSCQAFKRSFWLPENVNADKITAEFINGLRKLYLPKSTAELPATKKIDIV